MQENLHQQQDDFAIEISEKPKKRNYVRKQGEENEKPKTVKKTLEEGVSEVVTKEIPPIPKVFRTSHTHQECTEAEARSLIWRISFPTFTGKPPYVQQGEDFVYRSFEFAQGANGALVPNVQARQLLDKEMKKYGTFRLTIVNDPSLQNF